jgi:hypothetical protein
MEIMNTRLAKRDKYTIQNLTGLSKKCDWFINGNQLLKITNDTPRIIFLTGYRGNSGIKYLVNTLLTEIKQPFLLIIASEDYTFPSGNGDLRCNQYKDCQDIIKKLVESPLLIHIFVENLDSQDSKMSPIPLGLLQSNVSISDPKFNNINFSNKKNLCIIRNRIRTGKGQWADRAAVNVLAKNEWSHFVKSIDYEINHNDFMLELKMAKFCICIHGGGYDLCPKFFECILCGTIPIIQHSPLDAVFNKFPVVFINDLNKDALSETFLTDKYAELKTFYEDPDKRKNILNLLTLEYWWNIIINKIQ